MRDRIEKALRSLDDIEPTQDFWKRLESGPYESTGTPGPGIGREDSRRSHPSRKAFSLILGLILTITAAWVLTRMSMAPVTVSGPSPVPTDAGVQVSGPSAETGIRIPEHSPAPSPVGDQVLLASGDGWTFAAQDSDQGLTVIFANDTGASDRPYVRLYSPTCAFGSMTVGVGGEAHLVWWGVAVSKVASVVLRLDDGSTRQADLQPVPSRADGDGYGWAVIPLDPGRTARRLTAFSIDGSQLPMSDCGIQG